jgi:phosphatidylserine/phosphatidylglycerophosphate/cardiolipin synthase-like enzyme
MLLMLTFQLNATQVTALFSPDDKPTKKLLELIVNTRRSIVIAVYFLTDGIIADALIEARKRRVDIKIVLDPITTESRYGKADILAHNGIEVYVFRPELREAENESKWSDRSLMHNKYAVFDNDYVWTGSFNWTVTACMRNRENVVLIKDHALCAQYKQNFEKLLTQCIRYDSAEWHKQQRYVQEHCELVNLAA